MLPNGQVETITKGTPYIPLDYGWKSAKDGSRPVTTDVINKLPQIANGWDIAELTSMEGFLRAQPVIIGGRLRIMPPSAQHIRVTTTVRETQSQLARAEPHIRAGRIPVLKETTKVALVERALEFEIERYGRPLASLRRDGVPVTPPQTLFRK